MLYVIKDNVPFFFFIYLLKNSWFDQGQRLIKSTKSQGYSHG